MNLIQLIKDTLFPKQEPETGPVEEKEKRTAGEPVDIHEKIDNYNDLIEELISAAGFREYKPAGSPEAFCPSCGYALEEFPPRKMQCPSCKADIFVRTRESDKQKVLLNNWQLDEFERQRNMDSGRYDTKMKNLADKMEKYSETVGWVFLSVLDEKDSPEFAEYHGRVIRSGSEDEISALKMLIRPDSRARTKTWYDDPGKDTDPGEYEQQKKEWFDKYK